MSSIVVKSYNNSGKYFVTFTVKNWHYVFDIYSRWDILSNSLIYCIQNKGLKLHSFVFMINHVHLIISSTDVAGFIRDFKKFTSKRFKDNFKLTQPSLLKKFLEHDSFIFWQNTNMPINIYSRKFFNQKQNYIHQNPVKRNYVMLADQWYWSSANKHCELCKFILND